MDSIGLDKIISCDWAAYNNQVDKFAGEFIRRTGIQCDFDTTYTHVFSFAVIFDISIIRYPIFLHFFFFHVIDIIEIYLTPSDQRYSQNHFIKYLNRICSPLYTSYTKYRISNRFDVCCLHLLCSFSPEIIWCVSNFPNYYCLNVAFIPVIVNKPLTLHAIEFQMVGSSLSKMPF